MNATQTLAPTLDLDLARRADRKLRRFGSDLNRMLLFIVNFRGIPDIINGVRAVCCGVSACAVDCFRNRFNTDETLFTENRKSDAADSAIQIADKFSHSRGKKLRALLIKQLCHMAVHLIKGCGRYLKMGTA